MEYYIDVFINPDDEMKENVLLNKVYTKFHKALFSLSSREIGVSFPAYNVLLGRVIRIHGDHRSLESLSELSWLGGLTGYCDVSKILLVPDNVQYRTVSRKQSTMTNSKLKRLVKRGSIDPAEVKLYKAALFLKGLDHPYVEIQSSSNGHFYRRYFQFGELRDSPVSGEFDSFGLSKVATIPWF